jgi:hypothetical protein
MVNHIYGTSMDGHARVLRLVQAIDVDNDNLISQVSYIAILVDTPQFQLECLLCYYCCAQPEMLSSYYRPELLHSQSLLPRCLFCANDSVHTSAYACYAVRTHLATSEPIDTN